MVLLSCRVPNWYPISPKSRSSSTNRSHGSTRSFLPSTPADINVALTAVSDALSGKGNQIGESLDSVHQALVGAQPVIDGLGDDLDDIATLADSLSTSAPDMLAAFENSITTSKTVVEKSDGLAGLLRAGTSTGAAATSLIGDNRDRMITLVDDADSLTGAITSRPDHITTFYNGLRNLTIKLPPALAHGPWLSTDLRLSVTDLYPYGKTDCHGTTEHADPTVLPPRPRSAEPSARSAALPNSPDLGSHPGRYSFGHSRGGGAGISRHDGGGRMSVKKSLIRFGLFAALSILATVVVVSTLINPVSGSSSQYRAVFVNASGLVTGSDVQIAGVRVGRVDSVELVNNQAVVGFELESAQRIPSDGRAVVRYADLLGARTISIEPGQAERATGNYLSPPGATIPVEQTQPAIDLTDILGGFRPPLFDALDPPAEVNELAAQVVQVFQGQGSTIESLLERTVAVTENLTSRDAILDQLLNNLDRVLTVTTTNRPNFVEMINTLDTLVGGLAQDRQQISAAVDSAGALTSSLQDLVTRVEPDLAGALTSIDQSARVVVDNRESLATGITAFDQLFTQLGGIAMSYGSWANIYICNFRLSALDQSVTLGGPERSAVCR